MNELLPIGSVVKLKDAVKALMIYGILQNHTESNTLYDYVACLYPEGNISSEYTYLFNHDKIEEIYFLGFINAEHQSYRTSLGINLSEGLK